MEQPENLGLDDIFNQNNVRDKNIDEEYDAKTNITDETAILDMFGEYEPSDEVEQKPPTPPPSRTVSPVTTNDNSPEITVEESSESEEASDPILQQNTIPDVKKSTRHNDIISDIESWRNDYKDTGIPMLAYDKERIYNDLAYAKSINEALKDHYDNEILAYNIRDIVIGCAEIVPFVFNGQYNKYFKINMPDLNGYPEEVKRNISTIRHESISIAKTLNHSALGHNAGLVIKIVKTFGFPLFTVYKRNKRKAQLRNEISYDDQDEYSEEEDEEESSEE